MPHSLYLGSGIVQPRLLDLDIKNGHVAPPIPESEDSALVSETKPLYLPSLPAIKNSMKYSILELSASLFTFALFVNSAILIVAGLSSVSDIRDATLFSIHDLLSTSLAPGAETVFALALLFSGNSAGIICTIAGQMVSEGALNWSMPRWLRRLITRSISITPWIIIAGVVGKGQPYSSAKRNTGCSIGGVTICQCATYLYCGGIILIVIFLSFIKS